MFQKAIVCVKIIRAWKIYFNFQFKNDIKIEKTEHSDFCSNGEYLIQMLKRN